MVARCRAVLEVGGEIERFFGCRVKPLHRLEAGGATLESCQPVSWYDLRQELCGAVDVGESPIHVKKSERTGEVGDWARHNSAAQAQGQKNDGEEKEERAKEKASDRHQ